MSMIASLLAARAEWRERPGTYADLLLEPIVNGPVDSDITHEYENWQNDHGSGRRFYVAGLASFFQTTGLDATRLFGYRGPVQRRLSQETAWEEMTSAEKFWAKDLGKPQISYAARSEPVSFAKAAQVLFACELALEDIIANKPDGLKVPDGIEHPAQIYSRMGILPAVWYISDFTPDYLKAVRDQYGDPVNAIVEGAALESGYVISDMLSGQTVTRSTATRIQEFLAKNYNNAIGRVKAKPTKKQGNGGASQNEGIELG